uniref:Uncharacterized protein n=1 Tax=Clandestinovirus TaxID=2831644 RepID=A0A8F8PK74_9VIRU|nr:hypothetical protein KOM_12_460 [Clandestinovirus]
MSKHYYGWNESKFDEVYSGHYRDWLNNREDTDDQVDESKTLVEMECVCKVKLYNKDGRQLFETYHSLRYDDEHREYFDKLEEKLLSETNREYYETEFKHLSGEM